MENSELNDYRRSAEEAIAAALGVDIPPAHRDHFVARAQVYALLAINARLAELAYLLTVANGIHRDD